MTAPYLPLAADVTVRNRDLSAAPGLPLVAIARNESALLPDFLAHYRALGVQRFFILDDASDDGSPDLLAAEPDVCLLGSTRRYGDRPAPADLAEPLRAKPDIRMVHLWRTALMNRFCADRWALQCDVDEFLLLPQDMTLGTLVARLERDGAQGVWGGMIDLYPRSIGDLARYPATGFAHPAAEWFFDAERHFSLRKDAPPLHHSRGVRHRLDVAHAGKPDIGWLQSLRLRHFGRRKSPSGTLVKPILQHWRPGAFYHNSHRTTLTLSDRILLPLLHYRYTPAILAKLDWAMESGGYSKGNADYARLDRMLAEMRRRDATFLCRTSRRLSGFEDFTATSNAIL